MSASKVFSRTLIAAVLLGLGGTAAPAAPQVTPWITLAALQSGWVVDRMLVFPSAGALVNPDGCPIVTNGYIINERDPARKTFYAMLVSALMNQREVNFVISGCFEQRPRIVSVSVR